MPLIDRRASVSLILLAILAAFAVSACSGDDDGNGVEPSGNLFKNGGFEDGRDPWFSLRAPDWVSSQAQALGGQSSALLQMRETSAADENKIFYLVTHLGEDHAPDELEEDLYQDSPRELPEVISGNYYVDNWLKGTESQYLQFVVVLWTDDPTGLPVCPNGSPCPNYQIRYLLAGVDQDPFAIANAKFVYISSADPEQGKWVHFERNLREDFERFWGAIPSNLTDMRFLFEVRFDNKGILEGPLQADVYYDDLYLGPAAPE